MSRANIRSFLPVFHALQSAMAGRRDEFLVDFDSIPTATRGVGYPELVWLEGESHFHLGLLPEAKPIFRRFREHADVKLCPAWMRDLGWVREAVCELRTGDLKACRDTLKDIERAVEPGRRSLTLRSDLAALRAECYEADGVLEKATANYQLSFEEALDVGDAARQASAASNIGRLLAQMGHLRPAIKWQRRALKILGEYPNSRLRRAIMLRLARVERTIGHDRETWPQVQAILHATDLEGMPSVQITALTEAHEHDVLHRRSDDGVPHIVQALDLAGRRGLKFNEISLLRDLSRTYREQNDRMRPKATERGSLELLQAIELAMELPEIPMRVVLELAQDVLEVEELRKSQNLRPKQITEFPKQVKELRDALQSRPQAQAKRMRERREKSQAVQAVLAQLVREPIRLQRHTIRPSGHVEGQAASKRLKPELMELLRTCLRLQQARTTRRFAVDDLVGEAKGRGGQLLADLTVRDHFTELRAALKSDIPETRLPGPGNKRVFSVVTKGEPAST